jgi:hypothetical protein
MFAPWWLRIVERGGQDRLIVEVRNVAERHCRISL